MASINIDSTYGVIIIQDLNVVSVDENYARIYGYDSPEELLSSIDSFLDLISPDLHDTAVRNYKDTISGKMVPRGHTFTNIDRVGRTFTVFSIDHVIEWQKKPALQVTVVDFTPLVEANENLNEHYENYKNFIFHSTQAIHLHRNFKPILVNQSWVNLMRAESIDFVLSQDSILDLIPLEDIGQAKKRYQNIIQGKSNPNENAIVENTCYDGVKRFFRVSDSLVDWKGEPAVQTLLEDVTERILLEKELLYRANHDQLTDLLNRSAIYEWLAENYHENQAMACLLIDLDDFKSINDTYGHDNGDLVIRSFADTLKEKIGGQGIAGRWGGEEFIAFIPDLKIEQALATAEDIREAFSHLKFSFEGSEQTSTVSIGISISLEKQNKDVKKLLKEADLSLYQTKENGKNKVHYLQSV